MSGRRYNCGCGKRRFRDEAAAREAAAADEEAYGVAVAVYRCPGGLAWHLTAHGFIPEALRSVGRRLAYELVEHGSVEVAEFRTRMGRPGSRRWTRVERCAEQMAALGLVRREGGPPGRLVAADLPGLRRVVQAGLDAYRP
ncbi:hypothetical protein [Actinoplanes sp. DH11]|uniref:hypothetical protein n=1 Tax=Actinoplanes sp. DH11 TaxID=2857011 RepID=UPI001E28E82D|nr:hypothetical protein [Actinoplanes sp. DH11]